MHGRCGWKDGRVGVSVVGFVLVQKGFVWLRGVVVCSLGGTSYSIRARYSSWLLPLFYITLFFFSFLLWNPEKSRLDIFYTSP